jgi:hypothetical protein
MNAIAPMNRNPDSSIARVATTMRSRLTALATLIRARLQARRRRIEQEKEFYRRLNTYCRAHNLPAVCAEDWKTAAYSKDR